MFGKYLDHEDKLELKLRQEFINGQKMVVEGLENLKQQWIATKFSKYGLDGSKVWSVNPTNGQIKEVKKLEPKK